MCTRASVGAHPAGLWTAAWPSRGRPGGWHLAYARQLGQLEGKVCWQVAEPWCQDLAPCVLRGLSCHMPVSVPAVELQMGRGAGLCAGWRQLLFCSGRQTLIVGSFRGRRGGLACSFA